ncbi:hypothetical protein Tco_0256590 [Tanacetum coccineum]
MTPSPFNTYQSSYNNPQFQQQFSSSQCPQYGSIHPTQHYSSAYSSTPLAMTYPPALYPNAYSSIVHQDACPQPQSIPQIEYIVSIVNQQTHLAEFPQIDSGLAVPVFKQGDDPSYAINKMMSFLDKVLLVEAQGSGKVLNEEELAFLADPGVVEAKAVLMANLSSNGSDVLSKKAQHIRHMLYDGSVIARETNVISIANSEETLMLEEESRSKMLLKQNFGKCFVPQQELSDEQAFRLQTLHPNTDQSASSPVKIKAPRELPKKGNGDMNTSVNVNSSVAMNNSVYYVKKCNKCLELEAKLIKQHNMVEKDEYNRLSKSFSKLEQHRISLKFAMQLNTKKNQKNNTSVNQTEATFDHLFELNNLKAELQAKDTTIEKLKANIKHLNKTSIINNVKKDIDEIETINIELEHRVAKLITENEHLK